MEPKLTEKMGYDGIILTEGLSEEGDTLVGHGVVVPLPVENLGQIALRGERLHDHHHTEVGNISQAMMAGQVAILTDNDDSLLQQVGVNCSLFLFAHKYHASSFSRVMIYIQ